MENAEANRLRVYKWLGLFAFILLVLFLVFKYKAPTSNSNKSANEITAPDLIRLIDADPANYTTELNKIYPGWQFEAVKNRWTNPKQQSALAIRINELRLMEPVKYYDSFSVYLESHDFNLISASTPVGSSKATKKIFENSDYIFTVEASGQYVMISLASR